MRQLKSAALVVGGLVLACTLVGCLSSQERADVEARGKALAAQVDSLQGQLAALAQQSVELVTALKAGQIPTDKAALLIAEINRSKDEAMAALSQARKDQGDIAAQLQGRDWTDYLDAILAYAMAIVTNTGASRLRRGVSLLTGAARQKA